MPNEEIPSRIAERAPEMRLEVEDVHGSSRVGGGSVSELAVVVRAPAFDLAVLKERTGV